MEPTPSVQRAQSLRISQGIWFLLGLTFLKWVLHLYSNGSYGFHRDELLHLSCSRHLAWGYMEFPPMIAWLGYLEHTFIGDSILATRFLPALAGAGIVFLTGLMTRIMGGGRLAMFLGPVCILASFAYFRNHTLFQPVAFDQFFWALSAYYLVRYLHSERQNLLLFLGLVIGLGLLTKYTIIVWIFGIAIGLIFFNKGTSYRKSKLWLGIGISLLIALPNIIWQYQHDWPAWQHVTNLYESQLSEYTRGGFLVEQFLAMNPMTFPVWFGGLIALFFYKPLQKYRAIGIAALWSIVVLFLANSKPYYLFSVYPVLFAAGAVAWEQWLKGKWHYLIWVQGAGMLILAGFFLPHMTPFLPIHRYVEFADLQPDENGWYSGLTSDYADMFGWEEQVMVLDSLYRSLSPEEQAQCFIWAENYGEAGAVEVLGPKYQLPYPVSRHGSFWLWGTGPRSGEVAISIGNETAAVQYFYEETQLIKRIRHPYAIEEEQDIPVYLCRKPKVTLEEYWPQFRSRVFQ